jgi:hypothetical protein
MQRLCSAAAAAPNERQQPTCNSAAHARVDLGPALQPCAAHGQVERAAPHHCCLPAHGMHSMHVLVLYQLSSFSLQYSCAMRAQQVQQVFAAAARWQALGFTWVGRWWGASNWLASSALCRDHVKQVACRGAHQLQAKCAGDYPACAAKS